MIETWFKLFFRNSKKNWLSTLINISGLAFGLAGLLIVLLYYNDEKSYNEWNPYKDEIYRVIHLGDIGEVSTGIEGVTFKEEIPEVNDYYLSNSWYDHEVVVTNGEKYYVRDILVGNPNFFDFFPFEIIEGNANKLKEGKTNIAISKRQANILFGKQSAIGQTIQYDKQNYLIVAIYKGNVKSYANPSIIIPFVEAPSPNWNNYSYYLFCKVSQQASIVDVEEKMNAIFTKYVSIPHAKRQGLTLEAYQKQNPIGIKLERLTDIRLHTTTQDGGFESKGNYQLILIMLSLSILLIIISCVNFINLSTASVSQRAKEVGVKKTLGLSKKRLVVQYVIEVILQSTVAFGLALILIELLLPTFNNFINVDIKLATPVIVDLAMITLFISLFIGSIPALYMANFKPILVLKGNVLKAKNGIFLRNLMLGIQFSISGFFLIGVTIILSQVNYMSYKELGFSDEQILIVNMNDFYSNRYKKYKVLKRELIKHPNIEIITSNHYLPGGVNVSSVEVSYMDNKIYANSEWMDYEYLDVLDIEILKGRDLKEKFASDTINNIIINETLAKILEIYNDPINKKIQIGFDDLAIKKNVIGMVKDYHIRGFDEKIPPIFMTHWDVFEFSKRNFRNVIFKIKAEDIPNTISYIREYWKDNVEQGYPFNASFLDVNFERTYAKYKRQQRLFLILTLVVIIMSLLGLFALSSLTIQQRLKEVAIRKSIGASVKEIMFQLIKTFLKITIIASVILTPIAYYFMQNWLNDFVYRIEMPLWPYIFAPLMLLALVFIVVGVKAYNATKVDLIKYLKFE